MGSFGFYACFLKLRGVGNEGSLDLLNGFGNLRREEGDGNEVGWSWSWFVSLVLGLDNLLFCSLFFSLDGDVLCEIFRCSVNMDGGEDVGAGRCRDLTVDHVVQPLAYLFVFPFMTICE